MEKRQILNENLRKVTCRFTIKEISNHVLPMLPDITWNDIKAGVKNYKLRLSPGNVGKYLAYALKNVKYDRFQHLVNRICLLDVALHKGKVWIPYSLLKPTTQTRIKTEEQMERLVLQAIRIKKQNGCIYAKLMGDIMYVMIIYKALTRKKGIVLSAPFYFCMSVEDPFAFAMDKVNSTKQISTVMTALGFEEYKKHSHLHGKNILSLLKILKNKENGVQVPDAIEFAPKVHKGCRTNIYLENEERLKHASHFLDDDVISLEELKVNGPEGFKGDYEEFCEENLKTTMQIKTANVGEFLKYLAWKGAIKPPFPNYIKKLNILGKNEITLKPNNN